MIKSFALLLAASSISFAQAGAGILGLGLHRYNPACAAACKTIASSAYLACTNLKGHKHLNGLSLNDNPPSCLENDEPYLTTSAYCMQQRCADQTADKIEAFWRTDVGRITGDFRRGDPPKWTYQEALSHIDSVPTAVLVPKNPLNETATVPDQLYNKYKITFDSDTEYENRTSIYSYVHSVHVSLVIPLTAT